MTILRGCKTNNQTYIDVEAGMIVLAFAKVSLQKLFWQISENIRKHETSVNQCSTFRDLNGQKQNG